MILRLLLLLNLVFLAHYCISQFPNRSLGIKSITTFIYPEKGRKIKTLYQKFDRNGTEIMYSTQDEKVLTITDKKDRIIKKIDYEEGKIRLTTYYTYDNNDSLTNMVRLFRDDNNSKMYEELYTYYPNGKKLIFNHGDGTANFTRIIRTDTIIYDYKLLSEQHIEVERSYNPYSDKVEWNRESKIKKWYDTQNKVWKEVRLPGYGVETFITYSPSGKILKSKEMYSNQTKLEQYLYDSNDRISGIKKSVFYQDSLIESSEIKYKYDLQGNKISENTSKQFFSKDYCFYNDDHLLIKMLHFHKKNPTSKDSILDYQITYSYHENGKLMKKEKFGKFQTGINTYCDSCSEIYIYDEMGRIIEQLTPTLSEKYRYESDGTTYYYFLKNEKWVSRVYNSKGLIILDNCFTYDDCKCTYEYDERDLLVKCTYFFHLKNVTETEKYIYKFY